MNTGYSATERRAGSMNFKNIKTQRKKMSTNKVTSDVQVLAWKKNMKSQDNRSPPRIIHPIIMATSENNFKGLAGK